MDIWEILQVEETCDKSVIRKAYAERAKEYNPEEHPEEFLRIREAYEKALAHARGADTGEGMEKAVMRQSDNLQSDKGRNMSKQEDKSREDTSRKSKVFAAGFHWDFTEENPFRNGEGIERFRELYTGKHRKDSAAWVDYFLSDVFLEGYREKDFAELMLEVVRENAAQYPPNKEFLTALYAAYGISAHKTAADDGQIGMVLQMNDSTAHFSGIEYIGEIAGLGSAITRLKGNEPAMAAGFRDYRELLALARKDVWDADALIALGKVIDRYRLSNISDRPMWNADQYELMQRHPKSLKLMTYFFKNAQKAADSRAAVYSRETENKQKTAETQVIVRDELPAEVYRILWSHLGLENATHGREKLLYGGLREAVLDHVPGVMEQDRKSVV